MEISFHSHIDANTVIATKFCTWHDSCAVVACAKICCDPMASNRITTRRSFNRVWIAGKKLLVKRAPGPYALESYLLSMEAIGLCKSLNLSQHQEVGLLNQITPVHHIHNFSESWTRRSLFEYHVHIWQVWPQLSCSVTYEIWPQYKGNIMINWMKEAFVNPSQTCILPFTLVMKLSSKPTLCAFLEPEFM